MHSEPSRSTDAARLELAVVVLLFVACLAAFGPGLRGDFVYDDRGQIVENRLIQRDALLGEALTSDVWAFKGERDEPWSQFWRPVFVLWLVACHRLFGLESTLGWHVASLLLHVLVCWLAWRVGRRLGLGTGTAAAVALVFAVHPVHVESVVWISGVTDPLISAFLLASLLALPLGPGRAPARPRDSGRWIALRWIPSVGLYALALLSKEVAVLWPAVVVGWVWAVAGARRALLASAPFAGLGALYLAARVAVLGRLRVDTPWDLGPLDTLVNAPRLLFFYLRQVVWPAELGPSYPLRAVEASDLELGPWLAVVAVLLAVAAATSALWRDRRAPFAALVALAPLAPALHVDAFHPEHIVHDRYLYLPLLGVLLLVALAVERFVGPERQRPTGRVVVPSATAALTIALTVLSAGYSTVWTTRLALWERAVAVDPTGAASWASLAETLHDLGRLDEASDAVDRSLALEPVTAAMLTRAEIALARGRLDAAAVDLRTVLAAQPDRAFAWELLAIVEQRRGRPGDAEATLTRGIEQAPHRRCGLLTNRAVLRVLDGRRDEARADLEAAVRRVDREATTSCLRSLFFLGRLEAEAGATDEAAALHRRFLAETAGRTDGDLARLRELVVVDAAPAGS